jgi:dihydropteroate synthase
MYTFNCNGRLLVIDEPVVMGIINVTPDSFYSGSRQQHTNAILQQAEKMLKEGATILDIGGQSTRPNSTYIAAEEELQQVMGPVQLIHKNFPEAFISIDTFHHRVAAEAVVAGACMVNDISGGNMDEVMLTTVASLKVPYVCMHMKGTPQTMVNENNYTSLVQEVLDYFIERIEACTMAGIHNVIVDPGFGFAKNAEQNFLLLKQLLVLGILQKPLLVGLSRKSTIYKTLGLTANEALNGTTVMNTIALLNGVNILRVHDVKEAKEAITLVKACQQL